MRKTQTVNYGQVIHDRPGLRIRLRQIGDKVELFLHRVEDGQEMAPRGYVLGRNYLTHKEEK